MQTAQDIMTSRGLRPIKGWPDDQAVDLTTQFDASITTRVNSGTTCSLNSSGKAIVGVGNNAVMPMWNFYDSDSPGIEGFSGDVATLRGAVVAVTPVGDSVFLTAKGSFELSTSEFVGNAAAFPPNTFLTAATSGGDAGKLVPGVRGTNMIVGQVSRGIVNNGYGYEALAFWPLTEYPAP